MTTSRAPRASGTVVSAQRQPAIGLGAFPSSTADLEQMEHIVLAGNEDDYEDAPREPKGIEYCWEIHNRGRAVVMRLSLFKNGWLKFSQTRRNKLIHEYLLDIAYIDLRPSISRFVPRRIVQVSLALGALGVLCGLIAYSGIAERIFWPSGVLLGTAALVAALICAYRTTERVEFYTRYGHAKVLTLTATLGCIGQLRRLVPELVSAIRDAYSRCSEDKARYLRLEMREHYRLKDVGIIADQDCIESTRRILGSFD